ncbi:MAG: 16S rRNA processing protein RimM [Halobacteriovoraceae bacterium]|nr:16S rRNA processing protein RimM [Halobacteriovoraceae bacterium]
MNKNTEQYILLGGCRKSHALRGQFDVFLENPENSILKSGIEVLVKPQNIDSNLPVTGKIYKINYFSQGNKQILGFEEISNRNQADYIIPFDIYVQRKFFPKINDDEIYLVDIMGFKAIDFKTSDNLGFLEKYYDNGAQIVLVISGDETMEIPFIDQFVKEIDYENQTIIINKLEFV